MASSLLGIPRETLYDCPYQTWPYMVFLCQNYQYWPELAKREVPLDYRNCGNKCFNFDYFEQWNRRRGNTDFPKDWEEQKSIAKSFSTNPTIEARQQNNNIYPWPGHKLRKPTDVIVRVSKSFYSTEI